MVFRIKNVLELDMYAASVARDLRGSEVIGLIGDLGAGKTTFVQHLAKHLDVRDAVKSPTFILMQIFATLGATKKRGISQLCHVDAYRLKDERELATIGFAEYAGTPGTVTIVEWADRAPGLHVYKGYKEIIFSFGEGEERLLKVP